MTTVLTRLELGDTDGHPFHGNQYTGGMGGDGDGKAGGSIRGDVGNRLLRAAMIEGLPSGGFAPVDARSWESLTDANDAMRGAAKAEIVAAAGADIAKAAESGPVRDEMIARYGHALEPGLQEEMHLPESAIDRDKLETDWMDRQVGGWNRETLATKSDEQLYGEIKAQDFVDSWAQSAAGNSPMSNALQAATADVMGAPSKSYDDYMSKDSGRRRDVGIREEMEGDTMKVFVQGEYDRTQAFLKDNGITEVTLHRGFSSDVSYPEPGPQRIDMNPASSWSVDRETAEQFSDNGFSESSGANAYVLTMTVPASDVISTARTGQGALHEGEVIVRNQPGSVAYVGSISYNAPDFEGSPVPDDELVTY